MCTLSFKQISLISNGYCLTCAKTFPCFSCMSYLCDVSEFLIFSLCFRMGKSTGPALRVYDFTLCHAFFIERDLYLTYCRLSRSDTQDEFQVDKKSRNTDYDRRLRLFSGPFANNREVKISLRQRQRLRERNLCVLTSSFLVSFLGSYSVSLL